MSERQQIEQGRPLPITVDEITADLLRLGVAKGMTLIVHSSIKSLGGWISGGPVAVIHALEHAVGAEGTLVLPTHSGDLSDPAYWCNPPVPADWWPVIRQTMPAYAPDLTPTRGVGAIPECFRKQEGVLRSGHPQVSFAARGPLAQTITANHSLEYGLGEGSPLSRLYALGASVLLLGVGYGNNTSLHLAEYRASYPSKKTVYNGAPLIVGGKRDWVSFADIETNTDDFPLLGADFERESNAVRTGHVIESHARLMPVRELVDYAVRWMNANRA